MSVSYNNQINITNYELVNLQVEILKEELNNKLNRLNKEHDELINLTVEEFINSVKNTGKEVMEERKKYLDAYLKALSFEYPEANLLIEIDTKFTTQTISWDDILPIPAYYYQENWIELNDKVISFKVKLIIKKDNVKIDVPNIKLLNFEVTTSKVKNLKKLYEIIKQQNKIRDILSKEKEMYKKMLAKATMTAIKNDEELNKLFGSITNQNLLPIK